MIGIRNFPVHKFLLLWEYEGTADRLYAYKKAKMTQIPKEVFRDAVGIGGLGVTCSPRDPKFACSNPAEIKILSTSPPGGTLSWGSRV